jgi:hypothetical protein
MYELHYFRLAQLHGPIHFRFFRLACTNSRRIFAPPPRLNIFAPHPECLALGRPDALEGQVEKKKSRATLDSCFFGWGVVLPIITPQCGAGLPVSHV